MQGHASFDKIYFDTGARFVYAKSKLMHTYLLINILTVFFPVVLSFERRVHFVRQWSRVLAAAVIVGIPFAWWDAVFTARGVWGFNREYLIGVSFFGLPAEEILFFICIPFACLFIYELVLYAQKRDIVAPFVKYLVPGMAACLLAVGLANYDKIYTAVTFIALAVVLEHTGICCAQGIWVIFFRRMPSA